MINLLDIFISRFPLIAIRLVYKLIYLFILFLYTFLVDHEVFIINSHINLEH